MLGKKEVKGSKWKEVKGSKWLINPSSKKREEKSRLSKGSMVSAQAQFSLDKFASSLPKILVHCDAYLILPRNETKICHITLISMKAMQKGYETSFH